MNNTWEDKVILQMQELNIIGSKQKGAVDLCFAPPMVKNLPLNAGY